MHSVVIPHDGSTSMEATLSWLVPFLGRSRSHVQLCRSPKTESVDVSKELGALAARLRAAGATAATTTELPDLLESEPGQLVVLHGGGKLAQHLLRESHASLFVTPTGLEPFAPRRILVPLDGSAKAEEILPLVVAFTRAFGAEVVLLRVAPEESNQGSLKARPQQTSTRLRLQRSLARASLRLEAEGIQAKVRLEESGSLDARILQGAQRCGADLIATSTRGHGRLARWLLGSCAERLLRRSTVPLLIHNARP